MAHAEMQLNLVQGLEMVAHVGERVFDQRRRKPHELPVVMRRRCRCIMVLPMLGDSKCRAAASQDSGNDGYPNPHVLLLYSGNAAARGLADLHPGSHCQAWRPGRRLLLATQPICDT